MEVKDIFRYVVEEIHTSIMATTDEDGHPVTCAIDLMDCDDDSIYFLTATGKGFYKRLICSPHIALTALKGTDTMHSVAVDRSYCLDFLRRIRICMIFTRRKNPGEY